MTWFRPLEGYTVAVRRNPYGGHYAKTIVLGSPIEVYVLGSQSAALRALGRKVRRFERDAKKVERIITPESYTAWCNWRGQ